MKVTILGCGASTGVPLIGCECSVCTSDNPKNNRLRVSVLIEINGINLLIDTSPDLRQQALNNHIRRVDAVLYTHDHADHTQGLDDLRAFNHLSNKVIPIYSRQRTIASLQQRFSYAFLPKPENIWLRPCVEPVILPETATHDFTVAGIPVTMFTQNHGKTTSLGYRIGDFAYSTDTNGLPDSALEALHGVKVWIVDCLRYSESFSHSHLELTLGWIRQVKPELAILTHMAHEFDYDILSAELPSGVVPGYDGMVLDM
jgi:phosphoribosyl 1,2-cyclic phosphate phosphodiesterase